MRKIFLYIIIGATLLACEDVLEITPEDRVSRDLLQKDSTVMDAYLAKAYFNTQFHYVARSYKNRWDWYAPSVVGGEHSIGETWQDSWKAAMKYMTADSEIQMMGYWKYNNIRTVNEIIELLESGEHSYPNSYSDQRIAEARFLRAFMYFKMVRQYGGVPLVTHPISWDAPDEELFVTRAKEQEVYDFIGDELEEISKILPEKQAAKNYGRPTRWAALALKSRAMLFAGSIAKYGMVQLDGLVGIPAGDADSYYQDAYETSMKIINESDHYLYNRNSDPMKNFEELFVTEKNEEILFAQVYDYNLNRTHDWTYYCMPQPFARGWGANYPVFWETVEKFEYDDGSPGYIDHKLLNGRNRFKLDEILHNRDPRFKASVFYPESEWQGGKIYSHWQTKIVADSAEMENKWGTDPDFPWTGMERHRTKSGMLPRKGVNESSIKPKQWEGDDDRIIFRLGEMYLNAAEAAFEKGAADVTEAMRLVNIIRDRAGMPHKMALSIEELRNERFCELLFEEHFYWDKRRWREAADYYDRKSFHYIGWYYYPIDDTYTLRLKDGDIGGRRSFKPQHYYFPITNARINDNYMLKENPGY